jgi:YqaJ-like viral recombinase domain
MPRKPAPAAPPLRRSPPPAKVSRPAPISRPIGADLRALGPVEIIPAEEAPQGSAEWFDLRIGIPTASNFSIVMASGADGEASKTRSRLVRVLAGEILTNRPGEGKIVTAAMQRGKDMEPEAREHYLRTRFDEVSEVGFIRRKLPSGRYVGASPDGVMGSAPYRKALEIKTMAPDLMIERLEKGAGAPTEHRAQVHGTMWVGDMDEVDLVLFYSGMPISPTFTIRRDETYCREIQQAVEVFDYEVNQLVDKIRRMA